MEYMYAGIVGAGTNNARLAGLLRGLGSYYYKEPTMLFLVRIAQGLVHMGKGLLTLNPYHTDNQLASGLLHPSIFFVCPSFASCNGISTSCNNHVAQTAPGSWIRQALKCTLRCDL